MGASGRLECADQDAVDGLKMKIGRGKLDGNKQSSQMRRRA